jgi:IclR family transcriptional regulator, pca regulon regulatory protein
VPGGEGNEVREAFERDGVAIADVACDCFGKREKRHWANIAFECDIRITGREPSSAQTPCDNRAVLEAVTAGGNPDFVLSLARGLSVIEAFQTQTEGATVGDIAARTGLSRAAVRRLLITLELLGYASHNGPVYRLSSRVLRLGFSFLSSNSLSTLAAPILEEIAAALDESSSLSILEADEIVYVARSATRRVMSVGLSIGSRLPAYCTSMGRVLLAGLPPQELAAYLKRVQLKPLTPNTISNKRALTVELNRVREQGYALVDQELELGLRSLAVPVRTRAGKVVAAMNTGVHAARVRPDDLRKRMLPILREGAARLAIALG